MNALFPLRNMVLSAGRFDAGNIKPTLTTNDHGRIDMAKRSIRQIRVEGKVAFVPLTKGHEAIIDASDLRLAEGCNWQVHGTKDPNKNYAGRHVWLGRGKSTIYFLHRMIMRAHDGVFVDHINGDGLDNRRANLRIATHAQNMRNRCLSAHNTTGYKGVSKRGGKFSAKIGVGGKTVCLGTFTTAKKAHAAYCKASKKYHGEFGRTK